MNLKVLIDKIKSSQQSFNLTGCIESFIPYLLSTLKTNIERPLLVITPNQTTAEKIEKDLKFYHHNLNTLIYPAFDAMPYFRLSPNPETVISRLAVLYQLVSQKLTNPIIISSLSSLTRKIIPQDKLIDHTISLTTGMNYDREKLINQLETLGYQRVPIVEDKGTYAVRGEIIDIFSASLDSPVRLDFFDDEIESLKTFDPKNQKTLKNIINIDLIPAREIIWQEINVHWKLELKKRSDEINLSKVKRDALAESIEQKIYDPGIESYLKLFYENPETLIDYLPPNTLILFHNKTNLDQHYENLMNALKIDQEKSTSLEKIIHPDEIFLDLNHWKNISEKFFNINLSEISLHDKEEVSLNVFSNQNFKLKNQIRSQHDHILKPLADEIDEKLNLGDKIIIATHSSLSMQRILDLLEPYQLPIEQITSLQSLYTILNQKNNFSKYLGITTEPLTKGFYLPDDHLWVITDEEIFGKKVRQTNKAHQYETFSSFEDLVIGDYIAHQTHGIGIYRGLESLEIGSLKNDFLHLEYLGKDKLYLPVDQISAISRYRSKEGEMPPLDKMGGTSWKKIRAKVKKATYKLAKELLELQAARESLKGFEYSPANEIYYEFEASFPYDETPDQEQAIHEVIKDMESEKPMDRLVCGDVGFGKTEVALRASCKAMIDKKQVAVLVPTTVLAIQHFETFKNRFKDFPVNVDILSRFQSLKQQNQTLEKLKAGKVDIIIGTHRLLSKDVQFNDLGLLIVDEEHRFGVKQKENIKKLTKTIDLLTLTATPIPRTLNFALTGIRDLSIINTPPRDRLAIRTYLTEFDEGSIAEAINREINRGGQVFFVHNRVQTIQSMKDRLQKILPHLKIAIAHGQMEETELENVMIDFMHKKYQLLLCTTIIESGIDIPSANTIIINRADHLGLAQLYQIRGRVGRSFMRAYCYLLVPAESLITNKAQKRLSVIKRFTELGSGFKIASHDLEIRGAGNILGAEQSGNITAIGYDLYVQLLEEAILKLKGEPIEEQIETEIKLPISTRIPEEYIPDTQLRLIMYKRISSANSLEECLEIGLEWKDRFGELPRETLNLIELIKIKILSRRAGIINLKTHKEGLNLLFHPESKISREYLVSLISNHPKKYALTQDGSLKIKMEFKDHQEMLDKIQKGILGLMKKS